MILAVDAGNSRTKWGLHDGRGWRGQGVAGNSAIARLADDWDALEAPRAIIVCNVAGAAIQTALENALARWPVTPYWAKPQASQCGVTNRYAPEQLGPDRWAALIGARRRFAGACLVVNAGTAITVDALTREGIFLGGLILPGLDLVRAALAQGTAGIGAGNGSFARFPANTADAVYSGALQAAAGAIERMASELEQAEAGACTLALSGGSAAQLMPLLNRQATLVDNLVLEGLIVIAQEGIAG